MLDSIGFRWRTEHQPANEHLDKNTDAMRYIYSPQAVMNNTMNQGGPASELDNAVTSLCELSDSMMEKTGKGLVGVFFLAIDLPSQHQANTRHAHQPMQTMHAPI